MVDMEMMTAIILVVLLMASYNVIRIGKELVELRADIQSLVKQLKSEIDKS